MRRSLLVLAAAGSVLLIACPGDRVFRCESSDQCRIGDVQGVCETTGVCSFPDPGCPSQKRYGEYAGDLSGSCVPADQPPSCAGNAPPPQSGGLTYHVSPAGLDSNSGTEAKPFATIQKAADLVNPGDTVIVEDGTYSSPSTAAIVTVTRGGAASNYVWFKARHRWGAKLDGLDNTNSRGWLFDPGVGYVRVEGFEIFGVGHANSAADGGSAGIECYLGGHHVQIIGNHLHHIGRLCTDTANSKAAMILAGPDALVEGNVVHDIGRLAPGENGCQATGPYYRYSDPGLSVWGAVPDDGGIPGAQGVIIRNNIFYNINRGHAVEIQHGTLDDLAVLNNTFALPNPYLDGQIGIGNELSSTRIINNIFFQPLNAPLDIEGATLADVQVSGNLTTASAMTGGTIPGLTVGANILDTDPLFVDGAARDFHLKTGGPAVDAGTPLPEVALDFDGCARPQGKGIDIGAYER